MCVEKIQNFKTLRCLTIAKVGCHHSTLILYDFIMSIILKHMRDKWQNSPTQLAEPLHKIQCTLTNHQLRLQNRLNLPVLWSSLTEVVHLLLTWSMVKLLCLSSISSCWMSHDLLILMNAFFELDFFARTGKTMEEGKLYWNCFHLLTPAAFGIAFDHQRPVFPFPQNHV